MEKGSVKPPRLGLFCFLSYGCNACDLFPHEFPHDISQRSKKSRAKKARPVLADKLIHHFLTLNSYW